jgi:hemoglobin
MLMKKDIENRADISMLMETFYGTMLEDSKLGVIFTDVAQINLPEHLPILCNFWESIIFHTAQYKGNPMEVHIALHEKYPLRKEHFDRWLELFNDSVDALFDGEKATLAKERAKSIAILMLMKINNLSKVGY